MAVGELTPPRDFFPSAPADAELVSEIAAALAAQGIELSEEDF